MSRAQSTSTSCDDQQWAERVMADWPPLTREQRDELWLIFAPHLAAPTELPRRAAA